MGPIFASLILTIGVPVLTFLAGAGISWWKGKTKNEDLKYYLGVVLKKIHNESMNNPGGVVETVLKPAIKEGMGNKNGEFKEFKDKVLSK